ncbi:MAG: hypothetical protein ABL894_13045 [Hyphomicrobium sp.]
MTDEEKRVDLELVALEQHLAVHGADPGRWPLSSQQRFVGLLASNEKSQRLLAEAKALERLVWDFPELAPGRSAKLRQNLTRAIDNERAAAEPSHSLPVAGSRSMAATPVRRLQTPNRTRLAGLPASAALAASLLLGIYAGAQGLADGVVEAAQSLAGQLVVGAQNGAGTDGTDFDLELALDAGFAGLDEEGTL